MSRSIYSTNYPRQKTAIAIITEGLAKTIKNLPSQGRGTPSIRTIPTEKNKIESTTNVEGWLI